MVQSAFDYPPLAAAVRDVRVPENAPLVALALLGTAAAIVAMLIAGSALSAFRRRRAAGFLFGGAAALSAAYAAALGGCAVGTRDTILPAGARKYFCELDCHLASSVGDVRRIDASGGGRTGRFLAVRLDTWFDPSTIAPFRGDAPLTPNPREAWIVDASGRRYLPAPEGILAAQRLGLPLDPLDRPLRPGERAHSTLVFDVPAAAVRPRLYFGSPPGIERAVVGHETSPGHGRVFFDLSP